MNVKTQLVRSIGALALSGVLFAAILSIPQRPVRHQLGDGQPVRLPTVVVFDDARDDEIPILLPEVGFDRTFAHLRAQRASARARP